MASRPPPRRDRPVRIVIVVSHPIQHFCPQYRSLATRTDVEVLVVFDSLKGAEPYFDEDFGEEVNWGADMLNGYRWVKLDGTHSMAGVLKSAAPDWLIVYGYGSPVARSAWRWALFRRVRLAYISDSELRRPQSVRRLLAKRVVLSTIFRRVSAFLSVGEANEDYYRSMGVPPRKIVRMNFPIDVDPVSGDFAGAARALRASLRIPEQAVVISTVGKLIERKRQADLIAACRSFSGDDVHLLVIGSGPDEDLLQLDRPRSDNVTFVGFVEPKDLPAYYELSDAYAQVSSYDPHPLAVSEGIAFGCVAIVSSSTGSWGETDDVQPGRNGFVVPTGDVDGLCRVFRELVTSPGLRKDMSQASRSISRDHQARAHGGFVPDLIALSAER